MQATSIVSFAAYPRALSTDVPPSRAPAPARPSVSRNARRESPIDRMVDRPLARVIDPEGTRGLVPHRPILTVPDWRVDHADFGAFPGFNVWRLAADPRPRVRSWPPVAPPLTMSRRGLPCPTRPF